MKTEIKNLNSFRHVQRALEHEIDRQIALLESGGTVEHETRLWDPATGRTQSMRSKEDAHDYRYFPEPDLPPVQVDAAWIEEARRALPELPDARRLRFIAQYALSEYDAALLTQSSRGGDVLRGHGRGIGQPEGVEQLDHGGPDPQDERDRRPNRRRAADARTRWRA